MCSNMKFYVIGPKLLPFTLSIKNTLIGLADLVYLKCVYFVNMADSCDERFSFFVSFALKPDKRHVVEVKLPNY